MNGKQGLGQFGETGSSGKPSNPSPSKSGESGISGKASTGSSRTDTKGRAGMPNAAALSPRYRTRSFLWTLFISGWAIAVGAAVWRGEKPELFVALVLTGVGMIGLLPALAASLAGLEAARALSQPEGQAGGEITVTVTLRSRIPLSLVWLSFRETIVNESGANERTVVFRQIMLPWWRKEWTVSYTVKDLERGIYRFLDCEATIGDVLGLTAVSSSFAARRQTGGKLAKPAAGDMRKQGDKSMSGDKSLTGGKRKSGDRSKTRRSKRQDKSMNGSQLSQSADAGMTLLVLPEWTGPVDAVSAGGRASKAGDGRYVAPSAGGHSRMAESKQRRMAAAWPHTAVDPSGAQRLPYRPGDDARRIDWRAASRGGIWMTKRDRTEWPPELVLLLDTSAEAYGSNDRIFDCAAGYMAALVRQAARADKPFRMLWSTEEAAMLHGAANDRGAMRQKRMSEERIILEQLGRVRPSKGEGRADAALEQRLADVPRGASLVVVTADWKNSELGERVAQLASTSGFRVEIHVLTPQRVPSMGMRERKRDWECAGIRVVWVSLPDPASESAGAVAEGGERHG
ncbi:protein of unknown function DUF58 [Paenibacillus curdlanolyticus YK9]|uniref:DUF58 domain-containing protein n=1 Tax=Paenibacillus curdlanolyticus YK9 TaxID=717606 RepID=E0IAV6_9BACL|nr:DUF58 domain-containing protein [Paenibacillus curdlanolyticus]EFM10247.1 protein of unknown function DUF58 [Paenibacillus curdlanolyticus YK9]